MFWTVSWEMKMISKLLKQRRKTKVDVTWPEHGYMGNILTVVSTFGRLTKGEYAQKVKRNVFTCKVHEIFRSGWIHDRHAQYRPSSVESSYFSFQPMLHDWCNKGCGMCYPVCGMVHIKEPLLLIDKSSLRGGSRFPFSLSEWSLTICLTPYNRR